MIDDNSEPGAPNADPKRSDLRDFLGGISVWAHAKEEVAAGESAPPRKLRRWIVAAVLGVVVVIAATILRNRPAREIPEHMRGEWSTLHPSHADRHFWLGRDSVAFQTGPAANQVTRHGLSKLKARRSVGDTIWYELSYLNHGQEMQWPVVFVGGESRSIRFLNQAGMEWIPVAGGKWPAE